MKSSDLFQRMLSTNVSQVFGPWAFGKLCVKMFELKFLSGRFPLERKIRPIRGRANNTLARKITLTKLYRVKPWSSTLPPSPKLQFPSDCTSYSPCTAAPSPQTKSVLYELYCSSYWTLHINNNKSKFVFDIPGSHSCDYIFHVLTNFICWANVNIVNISGILTMCQSDNHLIYMVISQTNFLYCHDVWFQL